MSQTTTGHARTVGNDKRALAGMGLCARCYSKHQRAGTLETYPSTKRRRPWVTPAVTGT